MHCHCNARPTVTFPSTQHCHCSFHIPMNEGRRLMVGWEINDPFQHKIGISGTRIFSSARLRLFGHVAHMPDNVPAKAVLHVACDIRDGVPPFPNWCRPWPGSSFQYLAAQDLFRLWPFHWRRPQLCPRIGPCGQRMLRPPWPCIDDDDDEVNQ